ncbi:MAG: AbrB/MazE/SpoVT family DNA-binding domain-containing protein [Planctomycetes bacterium]|nr:AbrB/MazE/SpoVT family DNA-binding domain-containing protein [Planctomycetota bacterium]
MVKTLTKHGNSWALIIDKAILDLLKIDPDTPLEVSTDGECLVARKAANKQQSAKVAKAIRKASKHFGPLLKRLA